MEKSKFRKLLELFFDYFKVGLFTFGGGLSMITLIEKTFVEKRKYITEDELLDITAIAESTPGVIAVNSATYIGYKMLGVLGSIFATIGVTLPSLLIIILISFFYDKFIDIVYVKYFIKGLMAGVTFLISRAAIKLFKNYNKNLLSYILMSLSFIAILLIKIFDINFSTIFVMLIGGAISLIVYLFTLKKKGEKENA